MKNNGPRLVLTAGALLAVTMLGSAVQAAPPAKQILIVVGPSNHPPGTHEVAAGGRVMKHCLEQVAGLDIALLEKWPGKDVVDAAATVVFIGDLFPPETMPEPERIKAELSKSYGSRMRSRLRPLRHRATAAARPGRWSTSFAPVAGRLFRQRLPTSQVRCQGVSRNTYPCGN